MCYSGCMGLRNLRTLIAIADRGGFSAAADRLHMTQSAVSMQMKALEVEWGRALFDRSRRPPVLNEAGWHLVYHGREIVERYDALRRTEGLYPAAVSGTLNLGVVPTAATGILPEVLASLRKDHPALTVRVRSSLSPDLLAKVRGKRLDAAIVTAPTSPEGDVVLTDLRTDELKLFVRRDLVEVDVATTLARHPLIRFTPAMGIGRIVDAALRERGIAVEAAVEIDTVEAMMRMVSLGLGGAIIPASAVASREDAGVLAMQLDPPLLRRLSFATLPEVAASPRINALRRALVAEIDRQAL